ncbi:MAG: primosomal protein N' [Thermoanaerobaculia bacterium]|nr:MAG: primosomal protein N' [Thermoanaerobaculia bacterium]MBZ0103510.1 primosomal protein N' [Thermoanaerobaculia bacterium]
MTGAPTSARYVEVAVPLPLPGPLTYELPADLAGLVQPGQRLRVPVGRRALTGVALRIVEEAPAGVAVRQVAGLADLEPAVTPELLDLAGFIARYYLAPIGEVLAAVLPADIAPWGTRRVGLTDGGALAPPRDAFEAGLRELLLGSERLHLADLRRRLPDEPDFARRIEALVAEGRLSLADPDGRGSRYDSAVERAPGELADQLTRAGRSEPARRALEYLAAAGRPVTTEELRTEAGVSTAVVRRLNGLGLLRRFSQPGRLDLGRHRLAAGKESAAPIVLRADQSEALAALETSLAAHRFESFLLQGVTGSGKTEVYLRAAAATLARGRSVLLLVPEIALVPSLAQAAASRFGDRLAVLHSNLGAAERRQEWERIRAGAARVVVGPRSAVFAPVVDLGLIVVDEEQDAAYKQEISPRYHGRDVALVRCRQAGAVALLASATPSLESRHAVRSGRLRRLALRERVGQGRLPEGILVDLREASGGRRPGELLFSERLLAELRLALEAGDQVILLRNRRGYAPLLLCRACGEDFRCPDCGLARTYHRKAKQLICHYCGSRLAPPARCPTCRSDTLEPIGAGTERVEEELALRLPGTVIDVLDRDAVRRVGGAAAILERFRRGESRILIGTQMLSKGHHFPGVALTAVLSADDYLGFPDFRAVERTYVLLTQLAGRAGRGERPGRVVLQTFHPDHYAIQAALHHDDEAFVEQEMRFRELFGYPPFSRMALILSRDRQRERALGRLREVAAAIERRAAADGLRITGPAPAPFERLRGQWRFQCIVRGRSGAAVRRAVAEAVAGRAPGELTVDIDPQHLL